MISSQMETGEWHKKLGGGAIADAILDRAISNSYHLYISGDSLKNEDWFSGFRLDWFSKTRFAWLRQSRFYGLIETLYARVNDWFNHLSNCLLNNSIAHTRNA
ncbi:hypothetical protein [Ruoffia tabacinasalis]|uniref:hypothetical protein n=1 Tax=Ruoffia tabacinasalis TaxID=87458 RepID=UPI0039E1920C